MKKLAIAIILLALTAPAFAKSVATSCTPALRSLGACTQAQAGDPGQLLFYWIPNARAVTIRDAFVARNYNAMVPCENIPDPVLLKPWDASVAYVELGHCTQGQADALLMVDNPISEDQWIDFQVRLWVRRIVRNYRIATAVSAVADPVRQTQTDLPVDEFEEEPDN